MRTEVQARTRGGEPAYLHGDIDRLHWNTVQVLITTAARAAQQGDAGRAEHVLNLAGVFRHDVHQPLQGPAVATAPHFLEGHHCEEAQTAASGQEGPAP